MLINERVAEWGVVALPIVGLLAVTALAAAAASWRSGQQLRSRCEQLEAALSASPGYLGIVDRRGVLLWTNRAWEVLEATHPLARVGVGDRWGERRPFGAEVAEQVDLVASGRRRYVRTEVVFDTEPAQYLELRLRRLPHAGGGAMVAFTNAGRRHHAEDEATRARSALVHMDRVAVLAELTSTITHELNQPLAAIHTNARVARRLLARTPPDVDEALAAIDDVRADSERAAAVIGHLRELLRRGTPATTVEDLQALARDAASLVEPEARARGVLLSLELEGEELRVEVDAVQIQQLVLNLISNAFDAVEARPRSERRVTIQTRAIGSELVELVVRDSGAGIEPELRDQLFDSFFTTKASGLGLGLSICRTIAMSHHGALLAESNDNGATFRLHLPRYRG